MKRLCVCVFGLAAGTACAQTLTKANNTTALNLPGSWVEGAAPTAADTLVWNATVATAANSNATMGAGFAVAGLRVENPAADVRVSGTSLTLNIGAAGVTLNGTRNLFIDTPVATAEGASQTWTVGASRQLGFGRLLSLGGGTLSLTGSGTLVFLDKVEDLTGRAAPLIVDWNGPTGTVGTTAARKNVILTDRGGDEVTVNLFSGALTVNAPNDNYGLAIGMKRKETWNLSGGTLTVDSGSAFHIGGAGRYAEATGEGIVNLTNAAKLVADGTLPIYLGRPADSVPANVLPTKGTINLDGGSLETSRTFQKIAGSGGNTAAFHFDGGLLKATGANSNWFQNLDTLDVEEGGAAIEVVAGAQALILQSVTHGGAAPTDGGLTKRGAGALGVNNAFTGDIDVQAGVLGLENAPAGNVMVAAGAGLAFKNPADLAAALADLSGQYAIDGAAVAGLYCLTNTTSPNLSGMNLAGRGFVKMGNGILAINSAAVLAGATGGVTVAGGEFQYGAANAVPSGAPIAVANGGRLTFNYAASMTVNNPLTLAGNFDINDGAGSLYINWNGGTATFSAPLTLAGDTKIKTFSTTSTVNFNQPIGGAGNLVIGGGGAAANHLHIFNLNAASTFAGDVTLKNDAGANARFNWGTDHALPAGAVLMLGGPSWNNTYAMADLKGYDQTVKGLADAAVTGAIRSLTNSAATASVLTLNDPANSSYTGALGGRIDIVKNGTGAQALTGNGQGHTGTVAVLAGALTVGSTSLPNADVTVANGARIQPNAAGTFAVRRTILTGNGLDSDSRGALYFTGGTHIWNGELTLAGTARIGAYGGGVITKTLTGPITGAGTLNLWAGGGDITHENVYVLTGTSDFAGNITLEAGFGAALTLKLSGGANRLPEGTPLYFNPTWDSGANRVFCRLDLTGTDQRTGGLSTRTGDHLDHCRAVVNSTAATTSTLTINTVGGTTSFQGVIGASGPCVSAGAVNVVKQGNGAQIFKKGANWVWINGTAGANLINANVTVNEGAIGFSEPALLDAAKTVAVGPNGALLAPDKTTLAALTNDVRFTLAPASAVGLYDTWDVTAADPSRLFYYSGNAAPATDNTAALPNGVAFAGGVINITRDGALGDTVFGPVSAPVYLNGTTLKNNNNDPILAAGRTITINRGGAALTAGWNKSLTVLSRLTGSGALYINYDSGWVVLSNSGNDYVGGTTVAVSWAGASGTAAARLRLGASEVLPHGASKGDLTLNANATFDLNGFNETVNGLSSGAASALVTNSSVAASVLTVGADDDDSLFIGRTGGVLSLVKTGTGTLTLDGLCGHTGATVVMNGTLALGGACLLTDSVVEVKSGATLACVDGDAFGGAASVTKLLAEAQAQIAIPAGVEVTVLHFAIGNHFKKAGTWGPTGSGAEFVNDTLFAAGGGILRVLETGPQRGTVIRLR